MTYRERVNKIIAILIKERNAYKAQRDQVISALSILLEALTHELDVAADSLRIDDAIVAAEEVIENIKV